LDKHFQRIYTFSIPAKDHGKQIYFYIKRRRLKFSCEERKVWFISPKIANETLRGNQTERRVLWIFIFIYPFQPHTPILTTVTTYQLQNTSHSLIISMNRRNYSTDHICRYYLSVCTCVWELLRISLVRIYLVLEFPQLNSHSLQENLTIHIHNEIHILIS